MEKSLGRDQRAAAGDAGQEAASEVRSDSGAASPAQSAQPATEVQRGRAGGKAIHVILR